MAHISEDFGSFLDQFRGQHDRNMEYMRVRCSNSASSMTDSVLCLRIWPNSMLNS